MNPDSKTLRSATKATRVRHQDGMLDPGQRDLELGTAADASVVAGRDAKHGWDEVGIDEVRVELEARREERLGLTELDGGGHPVDETMGRAVSRAHAVPPIVR